MSSIRKKNGYVLVPSLDPDDHDFTSSQNHKTSRNIPPDLKPGLFVQFGKGRRYDQVSESEDIELKDLKPRKKPKKLKSPKSPLNRKQQKVLEEPVMEGDTIQRIALRYSCPVSELRRLNKLYSDLDLHALKTIKIPVKEHSLLLEAAEREKRRKLVAGDTTGGTPSSGGNSTDEVHFGGRHTYYTSDDNQSPDNEISDDDADDEYGGDSDTPEYRDISIQSALKWKHSRQTLLEKLDEDLEKARTTVENQKSNVKEVRLIFESPSVHPISIQEYTKQVLELPDWRILAAVSLVVFIVILIGFVVYFKWYKSSNDHLL